MSLEKSRGNSTTTAPDPIATVIAAVKANVPLDPYCPRERQPIPTVNDPGPMPLCICGGHLVHDAALAALAQAEEERARYRDGLAECEMARQALESTVADLTDRLAALEAEKDVLMDQGEAIARQRDEINRQLAYEVQDHDATKRRVEALTASLDRAQETIRHLRDAAEDFDL